MATARWPSASGAKNVRGKRCVPLRRLFVANMFLLTECRAAIIQPMDYITCDVSQGILIHFP